MKPSWVQRVAKIVTWTEKIVLAIGGAVLLLWLIDPVRDWLKANQLMDVDRIIGLCALAILFSVHAVERLNQRLDHFAASEERSIIPDGTVKVYGVLMDTIERCCDEPPPRFSGGCRRLDILGITLFSAWDHLQPQLKKKTFCDWDVTLACMSPEFAQADPAIPKEWVEQLPSRIRDITEFIHQRSADLEKRNVRVRLFLFSHLPAIHGFRVEGDEVFCSYIHWEGEKLAKPFQFYEHFAAGNRSPRAIRYRELFANWLERAHAAGPVPVKIDATANP